MSMDVESNQQEQSKSRKWSIFTALTMVVAILLASPGMASAEGSGQSSLSTVSDGFESSTWPDNNNDVNRTSIYADGCYTSAGAIQDSGWTATLYHQINFYPDSSYGGIRFDSNCFYAGHSSTVSWARPGSGNFYFSVSAIYSGRLSVKHLNIGW